MRIASAALVLSATWLMRVLGVGRRQDESAGVAVPQGVQRLARLSGQAGRRARRNLRADNIVNAWRIKPGAIHFGRLDLSVDGRPREIAGWTGRNFTPTRSGSTVAGSRALHGNLATISEIEARPDIRLYEAYIEQTFWGGALRYQGWPTSRRRGNSRQSDRRPLRQRSFGWPAIKATNLPAGGPAPPIAVPGVRVKAQLAEGVTAFAAIFNGQIGTGRDRRPAALDNHGLPGACANPPWIIGQVRYDYTLPDRPGLPGNLTPAPGITSASSTISASPPTGFRSPIRAGRALPQARRNFGIFAVIEQTLYRPPSVTEKGVSASLRHHRIRGIAYSPPDRNLIDLMRRRHTFSPA